ncbi:MAG: 23S rRNA (adenine2503-C2)-methyltransferase, partial [Sulfitobacter sp.]
MTTASARLNLLGYSQPQLQAFLETLGEKPYRAKQVMKWIHHRDVSNFDEMSDISKPLRAKLNEIAEVREPEIISERISTDGTRKWLMRS